MIAKNMKYMCQGEEYKIECTQYMEGEKWREEKRLQGLKEKCPFASNTRCGRPWEWWCKGGMYPFLLTTYEIKPGTDDIPVRDRNGGIKFIRGIEDIKETCLSGDPSIYVECPNYKIGEASREYVRNLKNEAN